SRGFTETHQLRDVALAPCDSRQSIRQGLVTENPGASNRCQRISGHRSPDHAVDDLLTGIAHGDGDRAQGVTSILTLPRKRERGKGRRCGVNQIARRGWRGAEGLPETSDKVWTGFDRQNRDVSVLCRRPGSSATVSAVPSWTHWPGW